MRAAAPPGPRPDIATIRAGFNNNAPQPQPDVTIETTSAGGVPADWVSAPGADPSRRMLYMHGGGYTMGSAASHRRISGDLSRAAGCVVLNLDYRLAPEAPFPAAVEDAVAAYNWMLQNGPAGAAPAADTFIAGDSAGGGLALATLMALRDAGDPLPSAAVTLSAYTDLAVTGSTLESRAAVDPIIPVNAEMMRQMNGAYLGTADPRTPFASPLYGDFSGLPPLLMQVGDDEVLLDDTLRVAKLAQEHGVDVTLHVQPGGFHVYQWMAPDVPESRAALEQIGTFVREHGKIGAGSP